ncbi:MAG: patatin-like phospholipase family protein [Ginsengibacter sp.]
MNKIGLVLSGGGARGFAHLGFLKVLDELNLKPAAISGVSSGAIFGALYSYGKTPDEILELAKRHSYFGISNFLWRKEGLFSMETIRKILTDTIPENSFECLKIPLYVNATDFLHNKTIFFSSGELINPLIASASFPVLFEAVSIENSKLVDGGVLDNFPVEPLVDLCDKIIGSHVNRLEPISDINTKFSKALMIERCFHLAIANSVYSKVNRCNIFIEPHLNTFGLFRMRNIEQIFEIGYLAALKERDNILRLMELT